MQDAVHEEAVLRAYRAGHRKRLGFAVHGTLRIPRLHRLVCEVVMEDANRGWWLHFFAQVMEAAGKLRELVVDWRLRRSRRPWNGGQSVVAPSKQFMARLEGKAEGRFFDAVVVGTATGQLRRVTLQGHVPAHWSEQLARKLGCCARVVVVVVVVVVEKRTMPSPGPSTRNDDS